MVVYSHKVDALDQIEKCLLLGCGAVRGQDHGIDLCFAAAKKTRATYFDNS